MKLSNCNFISWDRPKTKLLHNGLGNTLPIRVRDYDPVRDAAETKVGSANLYIKSNKINPIKSIRGEPRGNIIFMCSLGKNSIVKFATLSSPPATFPLWFANTIRLPIRQRMRGSGFSRECFVASDVPIETSIGKFGQIPANSNLLHGGKLHPRSDPNICVLIQH